MAVAGRRLWFRWMILAVLVLAPLSMQSADLAFADRGDPADNRGSGKGDSQAPVLSRGESVRVIVSAGPLAGDTDLYEAVLS
jgi:hypothetical protein